MPGYDPEEPCVPLSAVKWPLDAAPLIDPEWRTDTVLALARNIAETRDFDLMPILADALQDAGCDNQYVLNHCRLCLQHIPVCWVVSAALRNPRTSKPGDPAPGPAPPPVAHPVPRSWAARWEPGLLRMARWSVWFSIAGMALVFILSAAAFVRAALLAAWDDVVPVP